MQGHVFSCYTMLTKPVVRCVDVRTLCFRNKISEKECSMQDPISLLVAFLAGAVSFLSPCVLPLFPSYLSFITGMSFDELIAVESHSLKPVITNSVTFISGFSIVFIATGASLGSFGGFLLDYRNIGSSPSRVGENSMKKGLSTREI